MYNAGSLDCADLQADECGCGLKGADRAAGRHMLHTHVPPSMFCGQSDQLHGVIAAYSLSIQQSGMPCCE